MGFGIVFIGTLIHTIGTITRGWIVTESDLRYGLFNLEYSANGCKLILVLLVLSWTFYSLCLCFTIRVCLFIAITNCYPSEMMGVGGKNESRILTTLVKQELSMSFGQDARFETDSDHTRCMCLHHGTLSDRRRLLGKNVTINCYRISISGSPLPFPPILLAFGSHESPRRQRICWLYIVCLQLYNSSSVWLSSALAIVHWFRRNLPLGSVTRTGDPFFFFFKFPLWNV